MRSPRIARSLALFTLLVAAAPGVAGAAPADPTGSAPSGEDDQATRLLSAGNKAFKEGRFAEAEKAYREAFARKRGYDIAGNLGAAELAQGKLREGAQHLAFTLRMFPITGEPALREQMAKAFDQCRQGVGAIRVVTEARGATVLVDGEPAGEAPLADEVFVDPGEHVVEARLDGYTAEPQRVSVAKGSSVAVTIALAPVPRVREVVPLVPIRRRSWIPGLALGAVGVVGLVSGAAFLGVSASKRSTAEGLDAQILANPGGSCVSGSVHYDTAHCPTLQSTLHADDTFHDVAVGAFIVGGVAAAGAAAYFLWPQRAAASGQKLRVTPLVGAGQGGAVFSGSF